MFGAARGRPRVLDLIGGHVRLEAGAAAVADVRQRDRVAVLAHFSVQPEVTRSFAVLTEQLLRGGYAVVVVSASEFAEPLRWPAEAAPGDVVVVRKPNVGYDFGSWAVGLELLGEARAAPHVILANDSLVGPFADVAPILADFEESRADVWGLTDTRQFSHHLQSYFLGFRGGVLDDRVLRRFWTDIRHERSKADVIHRNELGLSRLLRAEGYVAQAMFRADEVVGVGENPTIKGWSQLLAAGFPFVKREIVTNPHVAPRAERVPEVVRTLFGVRLEDWL